MGKPQISAIVFDMDGLIVDTESIYFQAFQKMAEGYGHAFTHDQFSGFVGYTIHENIRDIKRMFGITEDDDVLIDEQRKTYLELVRSTPLVPMPGFAEVLATAVRLDMHRAVASSAARLEVETVLDRLFTHNEFGVSRDDAFRVTVTGDDVVHNKPHPEMYRLIADRLDVPAQECLACEDSQAGIESAAAAGMRCAAVPNIHTRGHDFSRADIVLDSLAAVCRLLIDSAP